MTGLGFSIIQLFRVLPDVPARKVHVKGNSAVLSADATTRSSTSSGANYCYCGF